MLAMLRRIPCRAHSTSSSGYDSSYEYPWLVGQSRGAGAVLRDRASKHARSQLGLFGLLKQRNAEQMGRHFASMHLGEYPLDADFGRDATRALASFVDWINLTGCAPVDAQNTEDLNWVAAPSIADRFLQGAKTLHERGLRPFVRLLDAPLSNLKVNQLEEQRFPLCARHPRYEAINPLKTSITSWHWVFGPCPPPPDHVYQHWLNFYSLIIPASQADKMDYHQLKEIKQHAIDEGIFVRIYVHFDTRVEFSLVDAKSGIPVFKDVRKGIDIQFTSPHYTPWDDIMEPYAPWDGVPVGEFGVPVKPDARQSLEPPSMAPQMLDSLPAPKLSLFDASKKSGETSADTNPYDDPISFPTLPSSSSSSSSTATDPFSETTSSVPSTNANPSSIEVTPAKRRIQAPALEAPSLRNLFTPRAREEEMRLKWDWRVCDVDYLLYTPIGHSVNIWGSSSASRKV
ncbi:hypothetical protein BC830DRAFT_1170370 [Chytriomyces sp. MP71]|nr:hypothetical protein BC830DRAFT_1170370 [Chytriomyces sp. MP71]